MLPGDPLRAKFIAETFLDNSRCFNVKNLIRPGYANSVVTPTSVRSGHAESPIALLLSVGNRRNYRTIGCLLRFFDHEFLEWTFGHTEHHVCGGADRATGQGQR